MVKAAVDIINQNQHPVAYRDLLNQVYMDLVDKKADFDSARQIENTLLNHNGREILLLEEADAASGRAVKKWWLGEERLAPEKKKRISIIGKISASKPKLSSLKFLPLKSQKSGFVKKEAGRTGEVYP